jgi:hypothetical protein
MNGRAGPIGSADNDPKETSRYLNHMGSDVQISFQGGVISIDAVFLSILVEKRQHFGKIRLQYNRRDRYGTATQFVISVDG